jgi:hypothetical protein
MNPNYLTAEQKTIRLSEIQNLRLNEKWTLDKIGILYGMSRERVRQILGNTGNIAESFINISAGKKEMLSFVAINETDKTTQEFASKYHVHKGVAMAAWRGLRHKIKEGSCAGLGFAIENFVSEELLKNGINHQLTNSRDVDAILDNGKTIEIKSRHCPCKKMTSKNFYFFPLERSIKKCHPDYFILVVVIEDKKDIFIIPKEYIPSHGGVGFCWPTTFLPAHSIYSGFHNRYDLLQ